MTKGKDGIVVDERGQDQPADKKRAQQAEKTDQGLKPVGPDEKKKAAPPIKDSAADILKKHETSSVLPAH